MLKQTVNVLSRNVVKSRKVFIAKTKNIGFGVFAKKNIAKGEVIFISKGIYRNEKELPGKHYEKGSDNWLGIGRDLWIDPFDKNPLRYLNHSCRPNASIKGKVTVVAIENIEKGDHISIDYSLTEENPKWKMKCKCGAIDCRKIIRSIQFLPASVFNRYPYMPNYFKKVYVSKHV